MPDLLVSLPDDPGLREAVGEMHGVEFVLWNLDGPPPRESIDIVVPPYWNGPSPLAHLAGVSVRLVQWQSIGYDSVHNYLPKGMPFANAASVHETATAELAMGLALASQRGIVQFAKEGQEHLWQPRKLPSLADSHVLLLGYGGVCKAIEARLAGFEVTISRVARSARVDRNLAGDEVNVRAFTELHTALAEADVVMIGVPLTDETRGLVGEAELAAMPDGALLVNVARGPVVDTEALMTQLRSGRLRAALDVTDPEPLPAGHPLWDCPNVLITPHVGGDASAMTPRVVALLRRQIAHMVAGEPPENLVL